MNLLQIVQAVAPSITDANLSQPFDDIDIDSFDLLTIRVDLERTFAHDIPDSAWVEFRSFADIGRYFDGVPRSGPRGGQSRDSSGVDRDIELNMPQMAIGSMSENWLFKEMGSTHWHLLCEGLDTASNALSDEMGNRLYATFARVQISGAALDLFTENENLHLTGQLSRYGNGMYYSQMSLTSLERPESVLAVRMITSFSRRSGEGNKNLVKSHPASPVNTIENLSSVPPFIDEYRMIKKGGVGSRLDLAGHTFLVGDESVFDVEYDLNPYYDLNGAGLLYFASYPTINDFCEAKYFNGLADAQGRWEQSFFTSSRDIMYYANCDINDGIQYRLNSVEADGDRRYIASSLYRKSDGQLMARVFTVKNRAAVG